ncbi:MAG: acetolactate decarboxylase, partial [Armatimonadota bacterium]
MKRVAGLIAALCVMLSVAALAGTAERETLCQTSTINALLDGIYDGSVTYGALSERGDFGIGTFNGLDGEMIAFDGQIWQIKADGKAYEVADTMHTPFAAMTFFDADITAPVPAGTTFEQLGEIIDNLTPGPNLFYAVRVDGSFEYMKTRSVPGQQKPYPPLVEVTRNQPEFEFDNITGTIAGFRCPAFVKGINVPGDHLHF